MYLLPILLGLTVAAAGTFLLAIHYLHRTARLHAAQAILDVAIAASFVVTLVATIPETPWGGHSEPRRVFALPFQELIEEFREDDPALGSVVGEMAVNVLLFFPLGLLVPLRWPWWADPKRVLAGAALVSLGIESIQFALGLGRTSSATDIFLNTAGAEVGYLVLALSKRGSSPRVHPPSLPGGDPDSGLPV